MLTHPVAKIQRLLSTVLTSVLLLAVLAACAQSDNQTTNNTNQDQKPIKIGFSVSLTGDYAADGKAVKTGYELWQSAINKRGGLLGRQVVFDSLDDGSKPDQATTNYQKLIGTDKVDLVLGPFSTLLNVPSAKVAERYNYPFVEGAGTGKKVFNSGLKTIFGVSSPSEVYLGTFAQYLLSLPEGQRPKTVAFATVDNPFAVPQVAYGKKLMQEGGIQTVFDLPSPYPEDTSDVSPIAKQIINSKADVVMLGTVGVTDCVSFIKTFKQQHYNPKAIIMTSGPDEGATFIKDVGTDTAEGVFVPNAGWFPGIKTYQNDTFTSDYLAKFGGTEQDINSGTVQGYSAAQVLEQAVVKANSIDHAKLMQVLRSETFNSLQGPVKFNDKGENTLGVPFLFQWQGGKLLPVYPASQAQANPEYPKKSWS